MRLRLLRKIKMAEKEGDNFSPNTLNFFNIHFSVCHFVYRKNSPHEAGKLFFKRVRVKCRSQTMLHL